MRGLYPDEGSWWAGVEADLRDLYGRAGQPLDWAAFRWAARIGFDVGRGLDPDTAQALHLRECAAELGLGPPPRRPPFPGAASYPDEPSWWATVEQDAAGLYAQAGVARDWAAFRWMARTGYDIGAGMAPAAAWAAHRRELVQALGIGPPVPVGRDVGPLRAVGQALQRVDGTAWFGLGITAFPLLQAKLDQEPKYERFLDYCQAHGLFPRFLGSYQSGPGGGIGSFHPRRYGTALIPALVAVFGDLAARGLRGKFDACADVQFGSLDGRDPADFFDECMDAIQDLDHALGGCGNEWEKNGFNPQTFRQPRGLFDRGSSVSDALPPVNPWRTFTAHPARNDHWPKAAKMIQDIQSGNTTERVGMPIPGGFDEMIGIGEDATGSTTNNPDDVFDFVATPFASYVVLHCRAGISLDVPGPRATACVAAAQQAAALMPAEFRDGQYVRGGLGLGIQDSPRDLAGDPLWWLRAYGRQRGAEQWAVLQRPRVDRGLQIIAAPGWTLAGTFGPRGNIVHLTR